MSYINFGIKSIQRGTIAITSTNSSATATLSPAIDTSKTEVRHLGHRLSAAVAAENYLSTLVLTNTTTVTAQRGTSVDLAGTTVTVSWEITERYR